ncbi:hypothetical protein [Dehalococcoides mccartyi]|uniref:hypothetical protein n=1 Tax=Dehalococcoides mccartyi TaxID=61435 RepID=UPI00398A5F8F
MAQYADIIEIVAPSEAQAGSRVDITVRIKNTYSAAIGIMVGGALEYGVSPWPGISFASPSANVNAGATYSFSGYFTMPDKKVTIHAYSYWYGADSAWHFDDEMTKIVNLAEVVASQFGSIEIVSYERRL